MVRTRPFAIITGGSSGIGFELAKQFAEHGFDIALTGSSNRVHASARAQPKNIAGGDIVIAPAQQDW